ncbi:MAG TPA: LysM domain-containing protein, partial [Pirellulales bacterium]|nr:LysM domain-containing protein [Pirellulales bacterium]
APHYDIYGNHLPAQPEPPQPHHQPMPNTQLLPHEHTPVATRFAPDEYRAAMAAAHQHDGTEKYTIRPNDSFYSISETVYGTGSYFKALEEHNREQVPYSERMRVGDVVSTPRVEVLEEKYPDLCPKRRAAPTPQAQSPLMAASLHGMPAGKVYVVQQGDSLFDIARSELGKASRWAEIYELNRHRLGDDIDYLAPGTELVLPETRMLNQSPLTTERRPPYTTR